jgi:hypothetical protein
MKVTVPAEQNTQIAGVRLGPPATEHTREPVSFAIQVVDGKNGVRAEDLHPFSLELGGSLPCWHSCLRGRVQWERMFDTVSL